MPGPAPTPSARRGETSSGVCMAKVHGAPCDGRLGSQHAWHASCKVASRHDKQKLTNGLSCRRPCLPTSNWPWPCTASPTVAGSMGWPAAKNLPAVGRGRGWLARGVHGRSSSLQPAAVTSLGVKRRGCPPSRAHHQAPCVPATCLGGEHASATAAGGQPAHHLPRLAGAVAGVDGRCGAAGRLCYSVLGVAGFNHLLQLS